VRRMPGARRPRRIHERIVEILLNIIHKFLNTGGDAERCDIRRRVGNDAAIARADGTDDVAFEQ